MRTCKGFVMHKHIYGLYSNEIIWWWVACLDSNYNIVISNLIIAIIIDDWFCLLQTLWQATVTNDKMIIEWHRRIFETFPPWIKVFSSLDWYFVYDWFEKLSALQITSTFTVASRLFNTFYKCTNVSLDWNFFYRSDGNVILVLSIKNKTLIG